VVSKFLGIYRKLSHSIVGGKGLAFGEKSAVAESHFTHSL